MRKEVPVPPGLPRLDKGVGKSTPARGVVLQKWLQLAADSPLVVGSRWWPQLLMELETLPVDLGVPATEWEVDPIGAQPVDGDHMLYTFALRWRLAAPSPTVAGGHAAVFDDGDDDEDDDDDDDIPLSGATTVIRGSTAGVRAADGALCGGLGELEPWCTLSLSKRYSEFVSLDEQLERMWRDSRVAAALGGARLPTSNTLGKSREKVAAERLALLTAYLRGLAGLQSLREQPAVAQFLGIQHPAPPPPPPSPLQCNELAGPMVAITCPQDAVPGASFALSHHWVLLFMPAARSILLPLQHLESIRILMLSRGRLDHPGQGRRQSLLHPRSARRRPWPAVSHPPPASTAGLRSQRRPGPIKPRSSTDSGGGGGGG